MFESKLHWSLQVLIGSILGLLLGSIAWIFISSEFMRPVLAKYGNVISSLQLDYVTIISISLCAGIGEEWFFRGFLQDYLGVIITSVIFVFIHGYLNIFEPKIYYYGILMTVMIIMIGYLDTYVGLMGSMAAHTMIDIILFYKLSKFVPDDLVLIK